MSKNYNFTPFNYGSNNKASYKNVPPPPVLAKTGSRAKTAYTSIDAISQHVASSQNYGSKKRYIPNDDDYFDEDEPAESNLEYIPAAGSPAASKQAESDDEEDPLDAFMAGLEKAESKTKTHEPEASSTIVNSQPDLPTSTAITNKGVRADIDDMDDEESYYKYMEDNPMAGVVEENSGDELEYDEDGNPIAPSKKRFIDPLPSIDHSLIEYKPFEKNFYTIHEEISVLSRNQINELRHKLGLKVSGPSAPAPVCAFAHFGFDDSLMKAIRKSEYVSV